MSGIGKISHRVRNAILVEMSMLLGVFILLSSCSPKIIPGESTNTQVRDSVVVQIKDSVVITPVERIKDIVPVYDTLNLETSRARAQAYVDTNLHALRGSIENIGGTEIKYVWRDRWQTRDSIQIKEVPVPYEVVKKATPVWCWWSLGLNLLLLLGVALRIYLKLR